MGISGTCSAVVLRACQKNSGLIQWSDVQEDIEIELDGAPDSQESPVQLGGFRVHSKELDGPLDTRKDSPDRVCTQVA